MKYQITAPPSLTEQSIVVDIPEPIPTHTVSGTTPIPTEPPPNLPPDVNAGNDITITLPVNGVVLIGNAKDPDGSILSVAWTQVSGPNTANIALPTQQTTSVTGLIEGSYTFQFEAYDNSGVKKMDTVVVTVKAAIVVPPPSAIMGFGAKAMGGEGKQVIKVTPATLMANIGSNRILQFTQGGSLTARIDLAGIQYLTIDANGFDVTVNNSNNGDGLSFNGSNCHHNIVKGLRVINAGNDGINVIDGAHDIAILNCSVYNSTDGNIDLAGGYNVTVTGCLIGAGKSGYNGSMLITAKECSVYGNLFINTRERNPMVHANYSPVGSPNADFRNNIIINWTGYATGVGYNAKANIVNNYYKSGTNSSNVIDNKGGWGNEKLGYLYAAGNVSGNGIANVNGDSNMAEVTPPTWAMITTLSACDAAKKYLPLVGTAVKNSTEQGWLNSVVLTGCN